MKSKILTAFTTIALLAVLAIPVHLAAQEQQEKAKHHHYQFIDLGTFGGPQSRNDGIEPSNPAWGCVGLSAGGGRCDDLKAAAKVLGNSAGNELGKARKRVMSAAVRAKLSVAAKRRWAKVKAGARKAAS